MELTTKLPRPNGGLDDLGREGRDLKSTILGLWTRSHEILTDTSEHHGCNLDSFLGDLDRHPFFSHMPRLRDDYEYFWAMLLHWDAPDSGKWVFFDDDPLEDLTQREHFLAFAFHMAEDVCGLAEGRIATNFSPNDKLDFAKSSLRAAKRAVAFVQSLIPRH